MGGAGEAPVNGESFYMMTSAWNCRRQLCITFQRFWAFMLEVIIFDDGKVIPEFLSVKKKLKKKNRILM